VPFYAVKSNPDPIIIMSYAILGTGFDCASETELKLVLSLGVHPDRIIYAQPRKFETDLIYAKKCGIKKLVFDSKDELIKIHEIYPEGEYILRIKTLNPHNTSVYNTKFGANYEYAKELIKIAAGMKANLIGISFNIGTNVNFVDCYQKAISDVSELFAEAKKYNISMNFLDLGGGWVGINDSIFEKITSTITAEIQKHFDPSIRIIAEPGRFMAAEVEQQVVRIIGMDEVGSEPIMHYYLSNGTYQSFFVSVEHHYNKDEIISDGISLQPFNRIVDPNEPLYKSVLWGPTCDSGDKVIEGIMLPKLKRGDYLYSLHTGAYNNAESTNFNGIKKSKPYYYYCPFK
jgi:ornithine decarboxylase